MKALVVCKHQRNENDDEVHKILDNSGIEMAYAWKDALTKKEYDLIDFVISIGGDGTALSASHYLIDKPLLAVNSDPEKSIGALTTITLNELAKKLDEIKSGNFRTENLERIEIMINGEPSNFLALNDVFIASEKAYNISKYNLRFKGVEEMQRSSGLIFSTGTGSTAWFKSAGGIPFSPQLKFIKMIVREPYCGKVACSLRLQGIEIKENEEIEIVPLVRSVLAVDSIREYILNPNDIVKIKISSSPLKRIL